MTLRAKSMMARSRAGVLLFLLVGCAGADAAADGERGNATEIDGRALATTQAKTSVLIESPQADTATPQAIGEVGTFQGELDGDVQQRLEGHAAFDEPFRLHLYSIEGDTLLTVIRLHRRGAITEPPAPGTYPVYSELAAGQLTAGDPRNQDGFFTTSMATQGRAGGIPSGMRETGAREWKPIGSLIITGRSNDRIEGRLEYETEGFAMPEMQKRTLRVEGSFQAARDPRMQHYEKTATRVIGG